MLGWLIEQYNTIKKVIVVQREAFYCFFASLIRLRSRDACRVL